jgi:hypothetical protein
MRTAIPPTAPGVRELARRSEFIGFVHGDPHGVVTGDATQYVSVYASEAVKGVRPAEWSAYPYLYVAEGNRLWYANRLPERSEALVFARRGMVRDRPGWVTVAVFPVLYQPAAGRRVIASLGGGRYGNGFLPLSDVRRLLPRAIRGETDAAKRLDPVLASVSRAIDALPLHPRHEAVLEETKALAARVEPGTTRADVEKLFPQEDGGLSGPTATRYCREPEVMVEVPYDQNGGNWKPTNHVNGPLRVYRSLSHRR